MRLWTLHPRYLDPRGLVAAWREGLLARAVLTGKTQGYRHHPQLERFRAQTDPVRALTAYLFGLAEEAGARGYHFDVTRIDASPTPWRMNETRGQLLWEWDHLRKKLEQRAPPWRERWDKVREPDPHPIFRIAPGPVRLWEKNRDRSPMASEEAGLGGIHPITTKRAS